MEFLANHIGTILAIAGGLGTTVLVVAMIFFGLQATVIIAAVVNFFKAVAEFLKTPLGQVTGVAALCLLCLFAGDLHGTRTEAAKCRATAAAAALAAKQRDADAAAVAAEAARAESATLEQQNDTLSKKVKAYETSVASGAVCRSPDNARRLRDIR